MKPENAPETLYGSIELLAQKFSKPENAQENQEQQLNKARSMILGIVQNTENEDERIKLLTFLKAKDGETLADLTKIALEYFMKRARELEEKVENSNSQGNGTRSQISETLDGKSGKLEQ